MTLILEMADSVFDPPGVLFFDSEIVAGVQDQEPLKVDDLSDSDTESQPSIQGKPSPARKGFRSLDPPPLKRQKTVRLGVEGDHKDGQDQDDASGSESDDPKEAEGAPSDTGDKKTKESKVKEDRSGGVERRVTRSQQRARADANGTKSEKQDNDSAKSGDDNGKPIDGGASKEEAVARSEAGVGGEVQEDKAGEQRDPAKPKAEESKR